ncbi:hypothetical protein WISP_138740 [Willisornis vidua]|uniref:Uncharacterized protein n=1 Tax=Willisornis vidua TaxID=1566151 RepID=A0ABQ9CSD1_9PASS|nr:hypothetical protein WISP_138740 [Willisornis vidua]
MSQIRRIPRHFVLSSYSNGAPEEETYSDLQTIPDTTEQMEFDIRYQPSQSSFCPPHPPPQSTRGQTFQKTPLSQIITVGSAGNGRDASGDNLQCKIVLHKVSATRVGHQLALIGDQFNRRYHSPVEDALLRLARSVAISVFQTWNIIKSVLRSFGNVLNSSWTKWIIGYGTWVWSLPFC